MDKYTYNLLIKENKRLMRENERLRAEIEETEAMKNKYKELIGQLNQIKDGYAKRLKLFEEVWTEYKEQVQKLKG